MVLIIQVPWIIVKFESESNFKHKAKETFPVKEKVSSGWVNVSQQDAQGKTLWRPTVAYRQLS